MIDKNTIIYPDKINQNLSLFLSKNWKNNLEKKYNKYGFILFKNFKVKNLEDFNSAVKSIHKKIVGYEEASTPRSKVKGKIYTSTQISAEREIPLHNEMSYASKFPKHLWFYSDTVAKKGGYTTIANSKKIYDSINKKIVKEFEEKKVLYIRKFGLGFDLSWQTTFNTNSKSKVNNYCKINNIKFKWLPGKKLITFKKNNFSIYNNKIKSRVWFNQAHLFHKSNYDKKTLSLMKKVYGEDFYPRDAKFGNNTEIPNSYMSSIRKVLKTNTYNIKWGKGDVALIDNLLVAHGRSKYIGERKVYVVMTNDK